jgi:hypothetical protein
VELVVVDQPMLQVVVVVVLGILVLLILVAVEALQVAVHKSVDQAW